MPVVAWRLGREPLFTYTVLLELGLLVAVVLLHLEARRRGWHSWQVLEVLVWALIPGLAGGRLFYLLGDAIAEAAMPWSARQPWGGGLSLPGALLAGAAGLGLLAALRGGVYVLPSLFEGEGEGEKPHGRPPNGRCECPSLVGMPAHAQESPLTLTLSPPEAQGRTAWFAQTVKFLRRGTTPTPSPAPTAVGAGKRVNGGCWRAAKPPAHTPQEGTPLSRAAAGKGLGDGVAPANRGRVREFCNLSAHEPPGERKRTRPPVLAHCGGAWLAVLGAVVPGLALGQALGWLGAAAHGAAAGLPQPPSVWWAPHLRDLYGVIVPRFPLQYLAAVLSVFTWAILSWGRLRSDGERVACYASLTGLGLLALSFGLDRRQPVLAGLSLDQIAWLVIGLAGLAVTAWTYAKRHPRRTRAVEGAGAHA